MPSNNGTGGSLSFPPATLAWTVWGLGALLYLIGFYQRVAPAVMTRELMADFAISAAVLGNLSAFYFYSYVAMQIPTGIIADRWGPRRLLALGAAVAGAGTLIFAAAPSVGWANIGRLLIGGSVAVAYVSCIKLASHWFSSQQFVKVTGMALFTGILGGVFAGLPMRELVSSLGWRPVMWASAILTLVLALAIWLVVRDDPSEKHYRSHFIGGHGNDSRPSVMTSLRTVLTYRNTWLLYFVPGGIAGSVLTFAGLWGVPFLATHYGLSTAQAATMTSVLLVAWALGGPLLGTASERLRRRKPLYILTCALSVAGWAIIIFVPQVPIWLLTLILIIVGFASGNIIIGFAFAKETVPLRFAGTVSGIANMGVMMGPMILQPLVGWMLDRYWQGQLVDGVRIYDLTAYRAGFTLMLAWASISLLLIMFTRESYCRQQA